jgi:hypothetical protein
LPVIIRPLRGLFLYLNMRRFITVLFIILASQLFAQHPETDLPKDSLLVRLTVSDEKKSLSAVAATIYKNGVAISRLKSNKKGRINVVVPLSSGDYIVEVSKDGYVPKKFWVTAYNLPPWVNSGEKEFEMKLNQVIPGNDDSFFRNTALAKIEYDLSAGGFDFSKAYTDSIVKTFENKAIHAKPSAAFLEKAYKDAIVAADKYYADKDYVNAIVKYKEALNAKPAEQYPREQIVKVEQLLEEKQK